MAHRGAYEPPREWWGEVARINSLLFERAKPFESAGRLGHLLISRQLRFGGMVYQAQRLVPEMNLPGDRTTLMVFQKMEYENMGCMRRVVFPPYYAPPWLLPRVVSDYWIEHIPLGATDSAQRHLAIMGESLKQIATGQSRPAEDTYQYIALTLAQLEIMLTDQQ